MWRTTLSEHASLKTTNGLDWMARNEFRVANIIRKFEEDLSDAE
jgi:hypothetical protein